MNAREFDAGVLAQIDAIRRIGRGRLRRMSDLDDFTQEVIIRLYASRGQLRDSGRIAQWAAVTARNLAVQWNRKRTPALVAALPELPVGPQADSDPALRAERWQELVSALGALDPVDRDLLVSYYVDEVGYAELQRRHGLSYSAVGVRLHRAKRKLRSRLGWLVASVAALFHTPHERAFGAQPMAISRVSTAFLAGIGATVTCAIGFGWAAASNADATATDPDARVIYVQTQPIGKADAETTLRTDPDVPVIASESAGDDGSLAEYHLVAQPAGHADFEHIGHTDHDVVHIAGDLASSDRHLAEYHLVAQPEEHADFEHIGHTDHDVVHIAGDLASNDGHLAEYHLVARPAEHADFEHIVHTDHDVVHIAGDVASNDGHLAEYHVVVRTPEHPNVEHIHHADYDVVHQPFAELAPNGDALPESQTTDDDQK